MKSTSGGLLEARAHRGRHAGPYLDRAVVPDCTAPAVGVVHGDAWYAGWNQAGRDTSETGEPGDNRDTDPIAGGGILGNIAQSR